MVESTNCSMRHAADIKSCNRKQNNPCNVKSERHVRSDNEYGDTSKAYIKYKLIPWDETKTGIVGNKRSTMLVNMLHHKEPLGRPSTYCHCIPERIERPKPFEGGVADAMREWTTVNIPAGCKVRELAKMDRDFVKLNKEALKQKMVTPRQVSNFHKFSDFRIDETARQGRGPRFVISPPPMPPDIVFGRPSKPGLPMRDLLEHRYGKRWLHDRIKEVLSAKQQASLFKNRIKKPYATTKSLDATQAVPVPDDTCPIWRMPKFAHKATPRISSWRDEGRKEKAMKAHYEEAIGKQGRTYRLGLSVTDKESRKDPKIL